MKGGIASLTAVKEHHDAGKDINGSIKIIFTADERGDAINGIRKLIDERVFKKVI